MGNLLPGCELEEEQRLKQYSEERDEGALLYCLTRSRGKYYINPIVLYQISPGMLQQSSRVAVVLNLNFTIIIIIINFIV